MDNKILIIGAGLAALYFFTKGGSATGGAPPSPQHWKVNGVWVHESVLPQYGYIKWNGQWYHQSQFQVPTTGQYAGVDPQSPQWLSILNGTLSAAGTLAQFFITNSGTLFGGGNSGQGGSSQA